MSGLLSKVNGTPLSPSEIHGYLMRLEAYGNDDENIVKSATLAHEYFGEKDPAKAESVNARMMALFDLINDGDMEEWIEAADDGSPMIPASLYFAVGAEKMYCDEQGELRFNKDSLLARAFAIAEEDVDLDMGSI